MPYQKILLRNIQTTGNKKPAGVTIFFKQWSGWGADGVKRNKSANGRILKGRTWDSYQQSADLPSFFVNHNQRVP